MASFRSILLRAAMVPCVALTLGGVATPAAAQAPRPAAPRPTVPTEPMEKIVAVVNGDAITSGDVSARGRLFALSTGLPVTPDVLERLRPQVLKQLVDERLRLQEVQRRKIVIGDRDIAQAISDIESRNGMKSGALGAALTGRGVALRTLIDQVRVQLGWTKVLRDELGSKADITDGEIAEQQRLFKEESGKPEYRVGEIFIPIDDPAKSGDAQRFAETVIGELRKGAPFPVVAAQFSQSQTALQGGDLGWVRSNQLDPEVATVIREMPPGAISNPVRVPGGIDIVTLTGKRITGQDKSTILHVRQVFIPFTTAVNPAAPTEQQRKAVDLAGQISISAKTCADMDAANERAGKTRPSDPGEVRLEAVSSAPLRELMSTLPISQASRPLVAAEGVAVMMVCSREVSTDSAPPKQDVSNRILSERIELTARQLQRDLRRRAVMDMRVDNVAAR